MTKNPNDSEKKEYGEKELKSLKRREQQEKLRGDKIKFRRTIALTVDPGLFALEQGYKRRNKSDFQYRLEIEGACISLTHIQHLIGALV